MKEDSESLFSHTLEADLQDYLLELSIQEVWNEKAPA